MSANGTGWVWTDFVTQNPRALGLGMTKCSISRNRLNGNVYRTQTNLLSMVYLHDNLYLYDCIWRLYYIFLCLCSLPSILCCAFTYFPHLSTTPFTKPFNAKLHCLQCYFLNFLPRLIFLYLSANSYRNIDYYCTQTQNVIKTKSTTLLNFEYFEKPICNFFWQIPT